MPYHTFQYNTNNINYPYQSINTRGIQYVTPNYNKIDWKSYTSGPNQHTQWCMSQMMNWRQG